LDRDGRVVLPASACFLARRNAHPPQRRRKNQVFVGNSGGESLVAALQRPQHFRDTQRGGAGDFAGAFAIACVFAQEQLENFFAGGEDFGRLGVDALTFLRLRRTRGHESPETFDRNDAHHTCRAWFEALGETQSGNFDSDIARRFDNRRPLAATYELSIYVQFWHSR